MNQNMVSEQKGVGENSLTSAGLDKKLLLKYENLRRYPWCVVYVVRNYDVFSSISEVDKIIVRLKKLVVNLKISANDYIAVTEEIKELAESYWKRISPYVRKAEVYKITDWQRLDDSYEEKLALARRRNTIVFKYRATEIAMLLTILKTLELEVINTRESSDVESINKLQVLGQIIKDFKLDLDSTIVKLKEKYNI